MSELEALVDILVVKKLAQMLGVQTTSSSAQNQWYDAEEAYPMLGLKSADQLRVMVRNGTLRLKKRGLEDYEVRDVRSPDSQIPRYQFHIEKCDARLSLSPELRQPKKANKKINRIVDSYAVNKKLSKN
ncbi:hypothetical protein [Nostoc sp. TCL240-02]|uniref:hypothetical protein n=1 Tax=Nostoc sp. TCL240-02 TaxID=2572090 RepID=UPI00157F8CD3|nr:hypothetical protein [Nostoc sp. TCL240-02]QKQ75569.1 hypothetical protein FBB35_21800 [Nostoc sp. TCL240-02]